MQLLGLGNSFCEAPVLILLLEAVWNSVLSDATKDDFYMLYTWRCCTVCLHGPLLHGCDVAP